MKKKILSVLLMSALVLSVASCGTSTETPETTTEGAEMTTTAAADEDVAETTTTTAPETEEVTTTTEAPKETPKITSEPKIYNDCMFFEADGKNYVYNIADKKMYEYNGESDVYGANGKIIINGSCLSNLETQETYDGKLFRTNSVYEYNPVYKIEESFDGDTYYFGIINKNGEWALPMSSDYVICKDKTLFSTIALLDSSRFVCSSSSLLLSGDGKTIYDWKNDKVVTAQELGKTSIANVNGNIALICDWIIDPDNIESYNTVTGESISIYDEECKLLDTNSGKVIVVDYKNEYMAILGDNFEKLYEITGYEARSVLDANENYVAFPSKGADGGNYIIILDKDGNRVVEPISYKANTGFIIDNYVILGSGATPVEKIINCKTGEIIDYKCEQFSASTGMMVVESDGAYYLAHISEPDTLINPFEIAE